MSQFPFKLIFPKPTDTRIQCFSEMACTFHISSKLRRRNNRLTSGQDVYFDYWNGLHGVYDGGLEPACKDYLGAYTFKSIGSGGFIFGFLLMSYSEKRAGGQRFGCNPCPWWDSGLLPREVRKFSIQQKTKISPISIDIFTRLPILYREKSKSLNNTFSQPQYKVIIDGNLKD